MSDINAVPSSTEPVAPTETLPPSDNAIEQEAGTAAAGEPAADAQAPATGTSTDVSPSSASIAMPNGGSEVANSLNPADAPAVAPSGEQSNASGDTSASAESDTVDAPTTDASSHLSLLDAMLAEIERKVGAGIHLFAHEVTAARDHLAKLL